MADAFTRRIALLCLLLAALPGCGKKGPLYLPDTASEVVTRPAETPPASESSTAPNSPQTVDSPPSSPAPTPEVPAPQPGEESPKKEKDGTSPPPK